MTGSEAREAATSGDDDAPGRVVTFYSYKGGTGRSMALANVACLLARAQPPGAGGVLAIDWDLEAPGLHRYFEPLAKQGQATPPGLIELFDELSHAAPPKGATGQAAAETEAGAILDQVDLDRFVVPTIVPGLSFMAAGRFDAGYAARVTGFDWFALHRRAPGLIPAFANRLAERYAWVLLDSRTGISDTSGICTMLMPELLVVVFTPNVQSLTGLVQLVSDAADYRRNSGDLRPLVAFPLPSRIEPARPKLLERWRLGSATDGVEGYQPQFETLFSKVYELPGCDLTEYFDEVQVQHAPDFAYGEQIAVQVEETDTRLSLRRSYETFTERLAALPGPWVSPRVAAAEREIDELRRRGDAALDEHNQQLGQSLLIRAATQHHDAPGARSPALAASLLRLGSELLDAGDLPDSEPVLRLAVETAERAYDTDDLEVVPYLGRLADALAGAGRRAEALALLRRCLGIQRGSLGEDHPAVAESYERLGSALAADGQLAEAEAAFRHSLDLRGRLLGTGDPSTATSLERLAEIAIETGRPDDARHYLDQALALGDRLGLEQRVRILNRLGQLHRTLGQVDQAERWFREAVELGRAGGDSAALTTADSLDNLARVVTEKHDYAQAHALYDEAHLARETQLGPAHPDTLRSVMNLGELAIEEGNLEQASRQFRRVYSLLGRTRGRGQALHPYAGVAALRIAAVAELMGDRYEAEDWSEKALQIFQELGDEAGIAAAANQLGNAPEGLP